MCAKKLRPVVTSILFILLFICGNISTHAAVNTGDTDPFLKGWVNNDGVATHYLHISRKNPKGYYRVSYEFPHTSYLSEMCSATDNIMYCPGLVLTRDDANHSITLSDPKFVYYDPAYVLPLPEYLGYWQAKDRWGNTFTINIMRGLSDREVRVGTSDGSWCSSLDSDADDNTIYHVTNNPDGTLLFTGKDYWVNDEYHFIYDPATKQIKHGDYERVGRCITLYSEMEPPPIIFEKK